MTQQTRGCFFALEGIDGSGKSTQLALLAGALERAGYPCSTTCEPTGGPVGTLLRQVLTGQVTCDSRVVAPLFVADRLDHLLRPGDGLLATLENLYLHRDVIRCPSVSGHHCSRWRVSFWDA